MKFTLKLLLIFCASAFMWGCSSVQPNKAPVQTENPVTPAVFTQTGKASFYADKHQRKKTANGDIFDQQLNTAAHKTLAFGSMVKVTNIANGKSIVVKINDRGPFVKDRIIDLSKAAFDSIADKSSGVIEVRIELLNNTSSQ